MYSREEKAKYEKLEWQHWNLENSIITTNIASQGKTEEAVSKFV